MLLGSSHLGSRHLGRRLCSLVVVLATSRARSCAAPVRLTLQRSLTSVRRIVSQIKQEDVVLRADDDREDHARHGCQHAAPGSGLVVGQLRLVVPGLQRPMGVSGSSRPVASSPRPCLYLSSRVRVLPHPGASAPGVLALAARAPSASRIRSQSAKAGATDTQAHVRARAATGGALALATDSMRVSTLQGPTNACGARWHATSAAHALRSGTRPGSRRRRPRRQIAAQQAAP